MRDSQTGLLSGKKNDFTGCMMWAFLAAQMVKNLPARQETRVPSLSGEDPLEEEMVTHSNILAWKIPWAEEPGVVESQA